MIYYSPITTSISVESPSTCEENTSAPEASESIRSASRPVPRLGSYSWVEPAKFSQRAESIVTFLNSSRSSPKPSATEDIQNFLNLSFNSLSFSSAEGWPFSGRNEGISTGGGEGEGDRRGFDGLGAANCAAGFCVEEIVELSVELEDSDASDPSSESDES